MMNRSPSNTVVAGAMLLLSACASAPDKAVEAPLAQAERAVACAVEGNAAAFAAAELRTSRTKLSKAKAARHMGDAERARRLAEQALVDAQVAESKAKASDAEQRANAMRRPAERGDERAQLSRNP